MGDNPVIVNELLCFISNKLDVIDNDSLIQLCHRTFSNEDATEAKNIMKEACTSRNLLGSLRITDRIGTDKLKRNIEDIVAMAHKLGDGGPSFVAKDLRKLPPVNFDNIDVTHLLWRLEKLEVEVKSLKETGDKTCTIMEDMLKSDQPGPRENSTNDDRIKRLRTATHPLTTDKNGISKPSKSHLSKPKGGQDNSEYLNLPIPIKNSRNMTSLKSLRLNRDSLTPPRTSYVDNSVLELNENIQSNECKSATNCGRPYSQVLREGVEIPWQIAGKKRKPKTISGALTNTGEARAAERTTAIFTSWWWKEFNCEGVLKFLKEKHGLSAVCEDVETRAKQYKCFKITFKVTDDINLFDPNLWPKGVRVAKFFNRPKRSNVNDNNLNKSKDDVTGEKLPINTEITS